MKMVHKLLQRVTAAWLFCLMTGLSCADFQSPQNHINDYAQMGKRAFFTGGHKGSSYPRIGRSSPSSLSPELNAKDRFTFHKRGLFTGGRNGNYPRVGRRAASDFPVSPLLSAADADIITALEGAASILGGPEEEPSFPLPLGLLFFQMDEDEDKKLSREEFVEGMIRARADGTLCR